MNKQNQPQVKIVNSQRHESAAVTARSEIPMIFRMMRSLRSLITRRRVLAVYVAIFTPLCAVEAAEYANWTWSAELPAAVATKTAPANRTAEAVDKFFGETPHPPSIPLLIKLLGAPDGFSPLFIHSMTQGSKETSKETGTLRFLLDDGGELHVWSSDYRSAARAFRYDKKGKPKLLYN